MTTIRSRSMSVILVVVATIASARGETPSLKIDRGETLPKDPVESALERHAEQMPKVNLPKLLTYNLEKLAAVYQSALRNAEDEDHRKAIALSQEAWLKFYEADGVVAGWNAKGGSLAYQAQVQQKVYQIKLRMYQLSTPFLEGWIQVPTIPNPLASVAPNNSSPPSQK